MCSGLSPKWTGPPRRAAKLLSKEEARRIAVNFAKLPIESKAVVLSHNEGGSDGQRG